ncbi:MAG: anhydro-N-acetylmuramic acid kinase [Bacteroidetes bacterium]|jgi:anhydro-N-acetylmuramic acid kinase|nr:anhydro-N-acetylmuramic acid kinase [Bacteroidota bacterium]
MTDHKDKISAIGLMSGSSLDGIDLVAADFWQDEGHWVFKLQHSEFYPYSDFWRKKLGAAFYLKEAALNALDKEYGLFLGEITQNFIQKNRLHPDFVASHGHTVFHQPEKALTRQIGFGQALADRSGVMVINDFRSEDVAKGGQGAPLVPIGDRLLFGDYGICLNIGGIANVSYEVNDQRLAFDCCIANQGLNFIAGFLGKPYDKDGEIAATGKLIPQLYEALNTPQYFENQPPKSLGREFFEQYQRDNILKWQHQPADAAFTYTKHIAFQIAKNLPHIADSKILVTGGGAYHKQLIKQLSLHTQHQIEVASPLLIVYKEALIFAFLGVLRSKGMVNVLAASTGAASNSSSGLIWYPKSFSQTQNSRY